MMSRPVLLDTDMGVDDAIALTLALCAADVDLVGVATVGGNVPVAQATRNVGRCLAALQPQGWPPVTQGFDQPGDGLKHAAHVHGRDGLGNVDLPVPPDWAPGDGLGLYDELIDVHGDALAIVAVGPLTNLARLLDKKPGLLQRAGRIILMGGAVFAPGNVTAKAEFNVYRDPEAAKKVLAAGLPVTLVPLDVTRKTVLDESHVAHLAASNTRSGQMLARIIEWPMAQDIDVPAGRFLIHDAVALGVLLWPRLFLQTQMSLDVVLDGPERGRTMPVAGSRAGPKTSTILSIQAADFLENLLSVLCAEEFVV
jgi:purine nucleosidase